MKHLYHQILKSEKRHKKRNIDARRLYNYLLQAGNKQKERERYQGEQQRKKLVIIVRKIKELQVLVYENKLSQNVASKWIDLLRIYKNASIDEVVVLLEKLDEILQSLKF